MLKLKEERKEYKELLEPPEEYEVEKILITTYSLDLDTLAGISICLGLEAELEEEITNNPICMLQALEKMTKKVIVVCQNGRISVPKKQEKLYVLLENMIYTITQQNKKNFHPKVWFIKYKNKKDQSIKYKLIVASKNLTFDRSWDVQISVEGTFNKQYENEDYSSMSNFIEYMQNNVQLRNEHFVEITNEIKQELKHVKFNTSRLKEKIPVRDCKFVYFDEKAQTKIKYFQENDLSHINSALIISPFIEKKPIINTMKKLKENETLILITRREELYKIKELLEQENIQIYVINEKILKAEQSIQEGEAQETAMNQDIHAKIFVFEEGNKTELFVGSANATNSAFSGNTEVMLNVTIYKNKILEIIKEDLLKNDTEETTYFEKAKLEDFEEDEDKEKKTIDEVEKQFFSITPIGRATKKEEKYNIELEFKDYNKIDCKGINIKIKPLLCDEVLEIKEKVVFENIQLNQLSEFYVVEFDWQEKMQNRKRIVKISTKNMPSIEDRMTVIVSNIIKDKKDFLEYLSFVFSDNYIYALMELDRKEDEQKGINDKGSTFSLYEQMLKTIANEPQKLKDVEKLLQYTKNSKKDIIPEGFKELYDTFEGAVKDFERK